MLRSNAYQTVCGTSELQCLVNDELHSYISYQGCTGDEREMAKQIASVSPRQVLLK